MSGDRLRLAPAAIADLESIKRYITDELCNPDAASKVVISIIEDYERLAQFPMMGTDLAKIIGFSTGYRFLVSGSYIVFYKLESEFVSIYRIIYGKRDYVRELFDLTFDDID